MLLPHPLWPFVSHRAAARWLLPAAQSCAGFRPAAAQAQPNINIMFLTTEVTTPAYYPGQDKHRLVRAARMMTPGGLHGTAVP